MVVVVVVVVGGVVVVVVVEKGGRVRRAAKVDANAPTMRVADMDPSTLREVARRACRSAVVAVVVDKGGRMRRAARRDANEVPLVAALRAIGCLVVVISGRGVPDLLVWTPFQRRLVLLEVKDGSKPPSARALTPAQVEFHKEWSDAPLFVVASLEEALLAVGATRSGTHKKDAGNND